MSAPTVGMIGAGQLAQMSLAPAIALGINLKILAADDDERNLEFWVAFLKCSK